LVASCRRPTRRRSRPSRVRRRRRSRRRWTGPDRIALRGTPRRAPRCRDPGPPPSGKATTETGPGFFAQASADRRRHGCSASVSYVAGFGIRGLGARAHPLRRWSSRSRPPRRPRRPFGLSSRAERAARRESAPKPWRHDRDRRSPRRPRARKRPPAPRSRRATNPEAGMWRPAKSDRERRSRTSRRRHWPPTTAQWPSRDPHREGAQGPATPADGEGGPVRRRSPSPPYRLCQAREKAGQGLGAIRSRTRSPVPMA